MDCIDSCLCFEVYEVVVWYKDGYKILLSDNGKILVICIDFDVIVDNIMLNGKNGVVVMMLKMLMSEVLQVGICVEIGELMKIGNQEFVDY